MMTRDERCSSSSSRCSMYLCVPHTSAIYFIPAYAYAVCIIGTRNEKIRKTLITTMTPRHKYTREDDDNDDDDVLVIISGMFSDGVTVYHNIYIYTFVLYHQRPYVYGNIHIVPTLYEQSPVE